MVLAIDRTRSCGLRQDQGDRRSGAGYGMGGEKEWGKEGREAGG
jgi:hypothetical protein